MSRDQARERARQHDAGEQSTHDVADHPAPHLLRRQMRRQRYQDLRGDREDAEHKRPDEEDGSGIAEHDPGQSDDDPARRQDDQPPVLDQIAETDDKEETGAKTELRQRDNGSGETGRHMQIERDRADQRLRVIGVRDGRTTCRREQADDGRGQTFGLAKRGRDNLCSVPLPQVGHRIFAVFDFTAAAAGAAFAGPHRAETTRRFLNGMYAAPQQLRNELFALHTFRIAARHGADCDPLNSWRSRAMTSCSSPAATLFQPAAAFST